MGLVVELRKKIDLNKKMKEMPGSHPPAAPKRHPSDKQPAASRLPAQSTTPT